MRAGSVDAARDGQVWEASREGRQDPAAPEIERLANEWMTAVGARDAPTLERVLAAEFRLGSSPRRVSRRSAPRL